MAPSDSVHNSSLDMSPCTQCTPAAAAITMSLGGELPCWPEEEAVRHRNKSDAIPNMLMQSQNMLCKRYRPTELQNKHVLKEQR